MFKVKVRLELATIDTAKYERELNAQMVDTLARAAYEYVLAAMTKIPVWSGASRATFSELAQLVGAPIDVTPNAGVADRSALGRSTSKGEFDKTGSEVSFTYETNLPHLIHNEYNNANVNRDATLFKRVITEGPYGFQEIAAAAAHAVTSEFVGPKVIPVGKKVLRKRVL